MASKHIQCPACKAGLKISYTNDHQIVRCPACKFSDTVNQFSTLHTKKVVCTHCKAILTIGNTTTTQQLLTCPNCKNKDRVANYAEYVAPVNLSLTQLPTQIGTLNGLMKLGCLRIVSVPEVADNAGPISKSEIIKLRKGLNLIGKQTPNSECSIQLNTNDEYMSRKHCKIDLVVKPDGCFEHLLSDAGSTNGTKHNGIKINNNDVIVLKNNDVITVGRTQLRFEV